MPVLKPAIDLCSHAHAHALWRLDGPDRVRFLNGQSTNDIAKLPVGSSLRAALCDAKGKMQADLRIAKTANSLFLDASPALRDIVHPRLDRYLIADEVEIHDVSADWDIYHLPGPELPPMPGDAMVFQSSRYREEGRDIWLPKGAPLPAPLMEPDAVTLMEIDRAIARWETELSTGILPPEARFDQDGHINYQKGCYIGQEVIARIKSIGRVNRLLCRVQSDSSPATSGTLGESITSGTLRADDQEAGFLTRACPQPTGGTLALAYLRRPHHEPGTLLHSDHSTWHVLPWPDS